MFGQKPPAVDAASVLARCQQCHGEKLKMANLSLASREAMLKGGDHGPAITPGNAAASLLYQRISGQIAPAMPLAPLAPLNAAEIAAVRDWINVGAPAERGLTPTANAAVPSSRTPLLNWGSYQERAITAADRQWWSLKKPVRSTS